MRVSKKYGRTYHFPFSPGTTSDDKTLHDWAGILENEVILTEKLDGENTCIKKDGVYGRSHASPTGHPWAENMWVIWQYIQHELGDLEIFGENLYGIHSIEYEQLPSHFFVFAMREGDSWLSWEEVLFYSEMLELYTIPVIEMGHFTPKEVEKLISDRMPKGAAFGGECEGFVLRNANSFHDNDFKFNLIKYVRANHVKTDKHWTYRWKRAKLWYEHLSPR